MREIPVWRCSECSFVSCRDRFTTEEELARAKKIVGGCPFCGSELEAGITG